ncbi:MAG: hypothetical protein CMO07_16860 [Thalassospira sp.]|nr:hypothetical protein [Thalassospira sp.]MBE72340.1 hypothetical protein [Thalassospira sp.]
MEIGVIAVMCFSVYWVIVACVFRDSVGFGARSWHSPGKNCRLSAVPGVLKVLTKNLCRIGAGRLGCSTGIVCRPAKHLMRA